ncbi:hypothetical protein BCR33DRAFT_3946 [Rhizoclosmatium globosum]|uniref:Uncharacterized protein n=1 Tax=Rhizoclosmatium globosum TaxID=329046 RepID=A0A1Y2D2X2_9FUNG|nr:hypothetical protein BCR33DRAFT_3946 [Rhizoclosmatium globosum]|eukprot:ORY53600.1 hypothetical protein BCR33DRAFT_3946 [Rhizoclosmatium globosum]
MISSSSWSESFEGPRFVPCWTSASLPLSPDSSLSLSACLGRLDLPPPLSSDSSLASLLLDLCIRFLLSRSSSLSIRGNFFPPPFLSSIESSFFFGFGPDFARWATGATAAGLPSPPLPLPPPPSVFNNALNFRSSRELTNGPSRSRGSKPPQLKAFGPPRPTAAAVDALTEIPFAFREPVKFVE